MLGRHRPRRKRVLSAHLHRGAFRTAYFLGAALRRALNLLTHPYRAWRARESPPAHGRTTRLPSLRPGISSRLSAMEDRLISLEQTLTGTARLTGMEEPGEAMSAELIEALSDPDPGVRRLAMRTIEHLNPDNSSFIIVEALHDPDSSVRCAAAATAAEVRATAAVFSLILSLADPALEVRRAARAAIEKITDSRIDFDPSADAENRDAQIERLKKWWKEERFARLAAEVEAIYKP